MEGSEKYLIDYLIRFLDLFGGISPNEFKALKASVPDVLIISNKCFSRFSKLPKELNLHQTQHSAYFIYLLARKLFEKGNEGVCEKLYLINRMINGVDLFYKIEMPNHFIIGHGLGTVFSRATYGDYLVVFQNTTIGVSGVDYPKIGCKVIIYPNCVISGRTKIGDNSIISAGSVLIDKDIPANSIAFGGGGSPVILKENRKNLINDYFDISA